MMNDITKSIKFLNNDVSSVFMVISIVLGIMLLVVGFRFKSKGKSTAGWIFIGIGVTSIISNVIQLIMICA